MALVQLGTLLGTFLSRLSSQIVLIIIAISFIILLRTGHFGMSTHINSQIILITNIIFPFRRLRRCRYFFGCDWKNHSFTLFLINITYIISHHYHKVRQCLCFILGLFKGLFGCHWNKHSCVASTLCPPVALLEKVLFQFCILSFF